MGVRFDSRSRYKDPRKAKSRESRQIPPVCGLREIFKYEWEAVDSGGVSRGWDSRGFVGAGHRACDMGIGTESVWLSPGNSRCGLTSDLNWAGME